MKNRKNFDLSEWLELFTGYSYSEIMYLTRDFESLESQIFIDFIRLFANI